MDNTVVPTLLTNIPLFKQEFSDLIETKPIWAPLATTLVANAKVIESPFTSVGDAKAHTQACRVPLSQQTLGVDELVLDRYIGNSITDCREELSYARFNLIESYRSDLYKSVLKKLNIEATKDFVADGDVVSGTIDLSTAEKVAEFLIGIAADADQAPIGLRNTSDGVVRVVRGSKYGKPFVAAGREAFVKIVSKVQSIAQQSSTVGLIEGNIIETPYGVYVMNLGGAADQAKRLIYGTAGVPTIAYREDLISTDMGEMTTKVTYDEVSSDLDIQNGDKMLEKTWYMSAQTKGKNGIFSNVQDLIKVALSA